MSTLRYERISANNSTPIRYSKKTRYSAIIRVQILSRIGGYKNRAGIRASTEHDFWFQILSFDST